MMLLGVVAGGIAKTISAAIAAGDYAKAEALKKQALDQYGPEMLDAIKKHEGEKVADTALNTPDDARLKEMQLGALGDLRREVDYNGATPEEQAQFVRSQNDTARQMRGYTGAIEQRLAQQGQANSPVAGLMLQQAAQNSTQRAAEQGTQFAADAAGRKFQALQALLGGAGSVRGQNFQVGGAQDAINQFNLTHGYNVDRDLFGADMQLKNARSNIINGQAADANARGNSANQVGSDLASGFVGVGNAAANKEQQDRYLKWLEDNKRG